MDGNRLNPMSHSQLDAREEVTIERMNASRAQQPHQVQGATALPQPRTELHQWLDLVKRTVLNALGDANQILGNHPAGTEIEVPYLAITHLAFGETHRQPAGLQ
jgi:hypothetical protein